MICVNDKGKFSFRSKEGIGLNVDKKSSTGFFSNYAHEKFLSEISNQLGKSSSGELIIQMKWSIGN